MKTIIVVENATLSYFIVYFRLLEIKKVKFMTRSLGELYDYAYVCTVLHTQRLRTERFAYGLKRTRARTEADKLSVLI